jgi:glycosyltransferase involved in cell wall biosynthesis
MTDVSVVIETLNARRDLPPGGVLADGVAPVLNAVQDQTFPRDRYEILLVLDAGASDADVAELRRRHPGVRLVLNVPLNYFAEKNAGVAASHSPLVAFMDSDCVPDHAWLESIVAPFAEGADVVTGRTRYQGKALGTRTLSIPAFGSVFEDQGTASGIILNNSALRREVALRHPLDDRIRRNGGCDAWRLHLLAVGVRLVYAPAAQNSHGFDGPGLGYLRKHFNRGYDSVSVYRFDDRAVLRGTRLFRRLGPVALAAITACRAVVDWRRLVRHRTQLGISALSLPYYAGLMVVTRAIELTGGLIASVRKH